LLHPGELDRSLAEFESLKEEVSRPERIGSTLRSDIQNGYREVSHDAHVHLGYSSSYRTGLDYLSQTQGNILHPGLRAPNQASEAEMKALMESLSRYKTPVTLRAVRIGSVRWLGRAGGILGLGLLTYEMLDVFGVFDRSEPYQRLTLDPSVYDRLLKETKP